MPITLLHSHSSFTQCIIPLLISLVTTWQTLIPFQVRILSHWSWAGFVWCCRALFPEFQPVCWTNKPGCSSVLFCCCPGREEWVFRTLWNSLSCQQSFLLVCMCWGACKIPESEELGQNFFWMAAGKNCRAVPLMSHGFCPFCFNCINLAWV